MTFDEAKKWLEIIRDDHLNPQDEAPSNEALNTAIEALAEVERLRSENAELRMQLAEARDEHPTSIMARLRAKLAWFEKRDAEVGHLLKHIDDSAHGAWLRWHSANPKPD